MKRPDLDTLGCVNPEYQQFRLIRFPKLDYT
jgi:hypothetical protein